jgi:CheY-like chemotaxis protein
VIERLAEGVAHEMNNMLAAIMGLASVVQSEVDPRGSMHEDLQGILDASRKGLDLTHNLLGFAKRESRRKDRIELNRLVGVTLGLLQRTVSKDNEIKTQLGDDLAEIEGDATQLKHVLVNLLTNATEALEASRNKRLLTITTKNIVLEEKDLTSTEELPPGKYIRLQISDTGPGMDEETLAQAFQPFFTTKGRGPGLGLAVVYDTVTRHGGRIGVVSKVGIGTTFTVDIPSAELISSIPDSPEIPRDSIHPQSGTALIVDDEPLILKTGERLLRRLGYNVIAASNGKQALECYANRGREISFVLLDLIMPEMDGFDVLKTLKEIDPAVKVIISSGYAGDAPRDELLSMGAVGFVDKPYTVQQLQTALNEAFQSSTG